MKDKSISIPKKVFADYSPFYLLDKILEHLSIPSGAGRTMRGNTSIEDLYNLMQGDEIFLHDDEYRGILNKLKKDKYVKEFSYGNGTDYNITFDGLVFIMKGGYVQKIKDIEIKREIRQLEKKALERNTKLTIIWSAAAAIIAAIGVAVQLIDI